MLIIDYDKVENIKDNAACTAGQWAKMLGMNYNTFYNWWERYAGERNALTYRRHGSKWALYLGKDVKRMCMVHAG